MKTTITTLVLFLFPFCFIQSQNIGSSPVYIKALTEDWQGERFPDGRPKVSDSLLERLKKITVVEVWAELIDLGYPNQFEGNWKLINDDGPDAITGRAVTAQFMPSRPDFENYVLEQGKKEGRAWQQKRTVSWAINTLVEGDFYVADGYLKPYLGTIIGSNLGSGVYAKSKRGIIAYGNVRDMEGLRKIEGFNGWIKGSDPSYMRQTLLAAINVPVRIGQAIVLPGDVVLAKRDGVIFIPPHLVENIVVTGEATRLFDVFGQQRIKEGKYSPGEIDSVWTDEINADFKQWAKENSDIVPMPLEVLFKELDKRVF
jgi:4-hydroxy-4-methyl-2-oxoglutarate aldolase